jgi:hypothetical protein
MFLNRILNYYLRLKEFFMSKGKFIPAKKAVTTFEESEVEIAVEEAIKELTEGVNPLTAKSAYSFYKNEQSGRYFVVEVKYDPNTLYAEVESVLDVGPDRQEAIQTFKIKASDLM